MLPAPSGILPGVLFAPQKRSSLHSLEAHTVGLRQNAANSGQNARAPYKQFAAARKLLDDRLK